MRRSSPYRGYARVSALFMLAIGTVIAAEPADSSRPSDDKIILVRQQPEREEAPQPAPAVPPAPTQPAATTTGAPSTTATTQVSASGSSGVVDAGQIAAAPSGNLGEVLAQAASTGGIETQARNAIIYDARVRSYHVGQLLSYGDGGFFFPARQDLDTAISKFDPGSIREILVIKGPYAVQYGLGFSFLNINTLDTPRYECGFEVHGRALLGYKSNGAAYTGVASVWGGDRDWGFRLTYDLLAGNDYSAGNGQVIPSSYNSNNVNFALGVNLTENSKLELKGLRLYQQDVEFAGLYFDINQLNSEAYNLRYTVEKQPWFDKLQVDAWYNDTVADGDTLQSAKQAFLSSFLVSPSGLNLKTATGAFPFDQALPGSVRDLSFTNFAEASYGYRAAMSWGQKDGPRFSLGSDFVNVGQSLREFIRIQQVDPTIRGLAGDPTLPPPADGIFTSNTGIPKSRLFDPGLFIEAQLPIGDRLMFKTGARGDYVHTSTNNRFISGTIDLFGGTVAPDQVLDRANLDPRIYSTDPLDLSESRNFGLWSAFLSGEYKFDDHLTGLVDFGYAERPPTLTELYAAGPFIAVLQQGLNRVIGDPRLDPEKNRQFDVGLRADYGWLKGGSSGFYAWIDDYITFDRNLSGDGISQVVFTNTDRATLAGGEIFGQFDLTGWFTPFGSVSYVQGWDLTHNDRRRDMGVFSSRRPPDNLTDNEPLPNIPPLEIRSGVRIHQAVASPKWSVEISARNGLSQQNVAASLGEVPTPAFTVWDVRSYWQVNNNWLLTAGVENFGDKTYREHLDPIVGIAGIPVLLRPGTSFYFTTQFMY